MIYFHTQSALVAQAATEGLAGYELSEDEWTSIRQRLDAYGRKKLEAVLREGSHTALSRMKDRYASASHPVGYAVAMLTVQSFYAAGAALYAECAEPQRVIGNVFTHMARWCCTAV